MHIVYFNQVAVVKLYPSSQNVNCLIFHNFEKPDTFGAKSAFGNQTWNVVKVVICFRM